MAEPAVLKLSDLNGANGFHITGGLTAKAAGIAVSGAGDLNGDGYDDLVIGLRQQISGTNDAGTSYVVFGHAANASAAFALASLNGTNGFRLNGVAPADNSGAGVSSAGDVNGDGIDDLIVGAHVADPNGLNAAGSGYVVFGRTGAFAASINQSGLNGATGFRLDGPEANGYAGYSVSDAGDVNGDGIADLIVGAFGSSPGGSGSAGSSFVVFGRTTGFAATLNLGALNGTTGFRIDGATGSSYSGYSVSSAGDVNGDGFDDLIVGAYLSSAGAYSGGASFVVFGKAAPFAPTLNLASLTGANGFRLEGAFSERSGYSVSSAGDVNGDGYDDLVVGAPGANGGGGTAYVVFGRAAGFAATLSLPTLNGANGFRLNGAAGDNGGFSVSAAGDVNGDGFADLIVGANQADPAGIANAGTAYVVFGKASGFAPSFDLSTLNGANGYRIDGSATNDNAGYAVSGAGDVNGDGLDDFIVGAYGVDSTSGNSATSYVVYGALPTEAVTRNGSAIGQTIRGGAGADKLNGLGGNDVLIGNGGIDTLNGGAANDTLNGGAGADKLLGGAGDDIYVDPAGDTITEAAGAANGAHDLVLSAASFSIAAIANVEDLTLTGTANVNAIGGTGNNRLTGNAGNNTLNGGGGNDTLAGLGGADILNGGPGNDLYISPVLGAGGDTLNEAAGAAGGLHDRIQTLFSFNLSTVANVEDITLVGAASVNAIGNNLANILIGNPGANIINGGGGNDTITGAAGNDTMNGGQGADLFRFAAANTGADRIEGFEKTLDHFDLSGGTFAGRTESGGNTTLTHAGGTIVVAGVIGLSLTQWRALVDTGARAAPASDDHAMHAGAPAFDATHHMPAIGHFGGADFLYA